MLRQLVSVTISYLLFDGGDTTALVSEGYFSFKWRETVVPIPFDNELTFKTLDSKPLIVASFVIQRSW